MTQLIPEHVPSSNVHLLFQDYEACRITSVMDTSWTGYEDQDEEEEG
jgi:hypothetical protein